MDTAELDAVAACLPHPTLVVNDSGRIAVANTPARELLGGVVEGRHFVSALRQPGVIDCIEQALQTGERRQARYQHSGPSADALYRVVAAPLEQGRAGPSGVVVSFEDIGLVEEAEQMRRDFVANVSHELRSPLTALIGFIETLRGAARHDAAARDRFLSIMEREAGRMTRLVDDLMSLTRVEANERVRPRAQIDLVALLENTVATLRPIARAQDVEITLSCARPSAMLPGDADQLTQVFHNLIENALKYAASGRRIAVTLHDEGHVAAMRDRAVRVDVRDWGEGFDPLVIPRLTERFYRIDSHRSREKGGTGLGLAIVKHIVNRHRGRLLIDSTPGQGSTFSVILPTGGEG